MDAVWKKSPRSIFQLARPAKIYVGAESHIITLFLSLFILFLLSSYFTRGGELALLMTRDQIYPNIDQMRQEFQVG